MYTILKRTFTQIKTPTSHNKVRHQMVVTAKHSRLTITKWSNLGTTT